MNFYKDAWPGSPSYHDNALDEMLSPNRKDVHEDTESARQFAINNRFEHLKRKGKLYNATIHTGECMNLAEDHANNGVPWHQQG